MHEAEQIPFSCSIAVLALQWQQQEKLFSPEEEEGGSVV